MAPQWASALATCLLALAAPASPLPAAQQLPPEVCKWAASEGGSTLIQSQVQALEVRPAARARSGTADDGAIEYIQALLDQRAAAEAQRMAAEAKLASSANNEPETAADLSGVKRNRAGDLVALLRTVASDASIILICFFVLGLLKGRFPLVYTFRDPQGKCNGCFGWAVASWRLSFDDVLDAAGLDHALLFEYTRLAMTILAALGIPFLCILSPMYLLLGGNAAGKDHLSWISMNNVHRDVDVVYWAASFAVWYAVLVTQWLIFRAHSNVFLPRRFQWLKDMNRLQATTVLVELLPEGKNTAQGVKDYFNNSIFGRDVVKEVFVVKDVRDLTPLVRERAELEKALKGAKLDKHRDAQVTRLAEVRRQIAKLAAQVEADDLLNGSRAFVTFHHRREATISLKLLSPDDGEAIEVVPAPEPGDLVWDDLMENANRSFAESLVGMSLIALLVWGLMPTVLGITVVTDLDNLQRWIPALSPAVEKHPSVAAVFDTTSSSLALTLVMGFLPTFLLGIFNCSFNLKARNFAQVYMQAYYFYFQVVFVLLVTAIGKSVLTTFEDILRRPFSIFALLAKTMPCSTHYYLSYFAVQWTTHGINATRYVQLAKYVLLARIRGPLDAKEMSEPEDQDYYGMGSRSARWSFLLTTALVFCVISPVMAVFGFINFALCRLVYGYLFVYAETKKPELGGAFWVVMLKQTQQGLFIFVVLMVGVLLQRAKSAIPSIVAAGSFLPLAYTYSKYKQIRWEVLEFADVEEYDMRLERGEVPELPSEDVRNYQQPELQREGEQEKVEEPETTLWEPQGLSGGQTPSL